MLGIDFYHHGLSLNVILHTLEHWQNKKDIKYIDFEGNSLDENKDIVSLFTNVLPHFPNLKFLNLSNTSLGMSEFLSILKYLSHCPSIKSLNFTSNFIFYRALSQQNAVESYHDQLEELVLDENDLGRKEIEMIRAQATLGFRTEEQEFKEKLEVLKEDRKDERVDKQASKQSKLISQRKGERGELEETPDQTNITELIQ